MSKRFLWLIVGLIIGAVAVLVAVPELRNGVGDPERVEVAPAQSSSRNNSVSPQPVTREGPAIEVSSTSLDTEDTGIEVVQPAEPDAIQDLTEEIPSGTVALFYRTSFGADTENLKVLVTDTSGSGNGMTADISWESGSKGIVRYIPETGQTDVIKTIRSTSYSKSSIYPITVGDRLYTVRDWGSEWTVDNKKFTVEELDPHTGATISSTDITAEWFTFLDGKVYFQSELVEDFWTGQRSGGKLRMTTLGTTEERDLAVEGARLHGVADRLASVGDQEIRWHNPSNGEVQSTTSVATLSDENLWPDFRHIFFGDRSVFWAWVDSRTSRINVMRAPVNGEAEALVIFELEGDQTGLVVDEHQDTVMIGFASPVPPNGIGITRVFLLDTRTDSFTNLPVEQHIPSAQLDAGGGLQLLVMP